MNKYLLILIVFLSAILRLYQLGSIPLGFTHDETALGYMGYSLMSTGFDRQGILMLRAVNAFGNWTLPLYPISTILPIMSFGLTEFAVRLPSALSGIGATILIYFIAHMLFKKKSIALIAALFFALSPWSIYFSRIAYETNLATTLFLGGLYSFLVYIERKKLKLLLLASILFGLTEFTYLTYVFFVPCFTFVLLILYRKKLKITKQTLGIGLILAIFTVLSMLLTVSGSLNHPELGVFNNEAIIYNRVNVLRGDNPQESDALKRVMHTKYLGVPYNMLENYLLSYSSGFLFDRGGSKALNNLGYFGNFYLFDALFLVMGAVALLWNREKVLYILVPWLVIGPIPSAITSDAPNSARLLVLLPPLILVAAYGAYVIFNILKLRKMFLIVFGFGLVSLYLVNVLFFLEGYFFHVNSLKAQDLHYGYREAALLAKQTYPDYNVVMVGPQNFPHLSFLFYNQYDPKKFQQEVKYNTDYEGLITVSKFGKYTFVDEINRRKILPHTLYIDIAQDGDEKRIIYLPTGKPFFTYFTSTDKITIPKKK